MSEGLNDSKLNHNYVVCNPEKFGPTKAFIMDLLSATDVITHEVGHNCAAAHLHSTKGYKYSDDGLSGNVGGFVFPSRLNTITILNDATNRSTLNPNE